MTNVKEFADQLSDLLIKIEDAKCEVRALLDAAHAAGVDKAALTKVAREIITDRSKLEKKFAAEEQLDLFRAEVGLFHRKGLAETEKAQVAFAAKGEKDLMGSAKAFDAVAGTDIAGSYVKDKAAIRKWNANRQKGEAA